MLQVIDNYIGYTIDVRMYMVYILVPLILISWIRNLKLLAPFSSIATCMTIVSFTLIFYYIFRETPSFTGREPVGTLKSIPLFFGTVLFAMEAIGMVSTPSLLPNIVVIYLLYVDSCCTCQIIQKSFILPNLFTTFILGCEILYLYNDIFYLKICICVHLILCIRYVRWYCKLLSNWFL